MAAPEIIPRAFLTLRCDIKQKAHYISDFQILYPAGSVLIIHNYYEKRQRHINLFERSDSIEMIVISPSRKMAAFIDNGEKGQIIIYDVQTLKKKRTLNLPADATTNRFETIAFSHDDVYLMAITGEPDWNMVTYKWAKGKVTCITKASYTNSANAVVQVCCSPTSRSEVCVIGPGLFRLFTMTQTIWRQRGFQRTEQMNITSATWLNGEKILCGTADGRLILLENDDILGIFAADTTTSFSLKEKDTYRLSSMALLPKGQLEDEDDDYTVRTLISFSKGFAFSCKIGYVHFFEKQDNSYRKRNVFRIPETECMAEMQKDLNIVNHLSINVSQDKLLATTGKAQIYSVRLWGPDINVAPEIPFKNLGQPLHFGPVKGLSMCIWKPIFTTFGIVDRTIRLWNYETETVQLVKQYTEDIFGITLHPTGNFMAIGLAEELQLSIILMNDIQPYRVIPVRKCEICMFSFQGNYLAYVNQLTIETYGTIAINRGFSFKGHIGKINAIRFTSDDSALISCGSSGAILGWEMIHGTPVCEFRNPGVCYWDLALSSDGKFVYAVGSDGLLIEIADSVIMRSFKMNQENLENIVLSRSNLLMFLSGDNASVLSLKIPLNNPPEFSKFHYHTTKIKQMILSFDDQTLVTVGEKGAIIIWKLNFAEGKTVAMDKNFIYSTEILINKSELQKKIQTIKNLSFKLHELELEQAKEMRDIENSYSDKIKELHESYGMAIEEIREKIDSSQQEHQEALKTIKCDIDVLKAKQKNEIKEMIESYKAKLSVEYKKVKTLELSKKHTVTDFESRVAELEQSKERETNEIVHIYKEKLQDVNNLLQELYQKTVQNAHDHEIETQCLQDDADREIVESRAKYEGILKEEEELNETYKDETVGLRKKHAEAVKEKDEFNVKSAMLQVTLQKYHADTQALEKDIADLKAEIMERDTTIEEKDKMIVTLKKKIQELDKFKFVLNYKIKELKNQIDPKDREIRERKEQITDMEAELGNLKKINSSLELQLLELKEKIKGTEQETIGYEKRHKSELQTLRQIKIDIFTLYQNLNDFKKLRDRFRCLCQKYFQEEIRSKEPTYGDTDIQKELIIKRDCLEKAILALESTAQKCQQNRPIAEKVSEDNVVLLAELNVVRRELKKAVTVVGNLEQLVGVSGRKNLVPSEAFNKLEQTLKRQDKIKRVYQEFIDKSNEETAKLKEDVAEMHKQLFSIVQENCESPRNSD